MMLKLHKKRVPTAGLAALALIVFSGCTFFPVVGEAVDNYASNLGYFNIKFYNAGESVDFWEQTSTYTLDPWQKQHILYAVNYWEHVLAPGLHPSVASDVNVITYNVNNAFASSPSITIGDDNPPLAMNLLAYLLQGYGTEYADLATLIGIGQPLYPTGMPESEFLTPLCTGNNGTLTNTMIHEMGHALGIAAATDDYFFPNKDHIYNSHLYDWRGQQVQPGLEIKTLKHTPGGTTYFDLPGYSKLADDNTNKLPYFSGKNVAEVLNGAKMTVYSSRGTVIDQDPVPGVPINGVEYLSNGQGGFEEYIDLSHIELRNSMMSHQRFRNYFAFMEAELAILQDIGYTIDRRDFYGSSIYGNGLTVYNQNPYFARNEEGSAYLTNTYNSNDFGIGLHIYGSHNKVYQEADLLTDGTAGMGIRVDGTDNDITVEPGIHVQADGLNGNGLLVAFGKNHQILLAPGSIVTANGQGGIGADFNFGHGQTGHSMGARSSYGAWSHILTDQLLDAASVEVDGPLVNDFTVDGILQGSTAAIHMADNAYVKNVTIGDTALIKGDIHNEWLYDYDDIVNAGGALDALLYRQYTGSGELTTRLSLNGISYDGDIIGKKNTRLSFAKGTNEYTGKAQVLSVEVAEGAALEGSGTYDLMTPDDAARHTLNYRLQASESQDARKLSGVGLFTNHGTLGATTGNVNIVGDLISDGNLKMAFTDSGSQVYLLNVAGSADITGSSLLIGSQNKPLFNKEYNYLTAAQGITGNIPVSNWSDYVQVTGTVEGSNAFLTVRQSKALEDTAGLNHNELSVARAFEQAAPNLMTQEDPVGQQAANVFYNNAGDMKKLMRSVAAAERTKLLGQTPMSNLTADSLYGRLDTNAFDGILEVPVHIPSLAGENKTVNADIPAALDANNNLWLKMFRGFEAYGGTDGEADLNSQSFGGVVGYDRAVGKDARLGSFLAYGKTNYSADHLNGNSSDWRLGFYGDKRDGDWEYQGYVSYGANHYDLDSYTWNNRTKLNSDFQAKIWDVGLKAKYTIPSTKEKAWKIRPYGELSYTHTSQDGYTESGSSAFAQNIDSASNNSTRAELGVEFKRRITPTSGWGGAIGYKRILSGVDPELNGTFLGGTDSFTVKTENDRNYLTYNLNAYTSLGGKWTGQAEIRGERSSNNHKEVYSLSAQYHF